MAAQPDISSILAALAQRSASTPSQPTPAPGQQPGLPPGYPAGLPQQIPQVSTPQLGGYSLPQPTNTGNVDLSAIRPVNSGSVSIADAIAKAKSIAADRGINYDSRANPGPPREDPRLAGRSYGGNRRSRSRSPPRRADGFRDNYNPYRDERRDADRRSDRTFGRDRTASPARGRNFSPPRGGGGARSPPNRAGGGAGAGAGAGDSETISVKSSLVGLIIGRQGENLRRVEAESGARVQFIPAREPNAVHRQCTISGSLRSRETAKAEIFRVMEDNGEMPDNAPPPDMRGGSRGGRLDKQQNQPALREGENSVQIMVPDKTVGLIIGRGGETIRDLQERSGCHVNIVAENKSVNGLRPVNLIGTPHAASVAKEMILEIVESDTRAPPGGQAPPDRNRGGFESYNRGSNDRGNDAGKVTEEIFVPSEAVGMIIGKGGETIKEMQSVTGCKINVSQPQQPDVQRQIGLVGSPAAIAEAKRTIWEKVDTVQQRDQAGGRERRNNNNNNSSSRNDGYGNQYSQPQQQQPYGQPPMGGAPQGIPQMSGMSMPGMTQPSPSAHAGGDPSADPYAAYGGYQNYVAMWYAALAGGAGGQQGQPPMPQ